MVDTKPGYRADIEGLRALAVILVILYHFEVPGITGGFIGVDVFFVISGFVITQLLERAFAKGSFSFRDFYARRIRRLVPLFLLVSTVTFVVVSLFYIGDAYYIFAKSWLSSLIGISNLYYFSELTQYFAPETRSLSLLHTWSLAVEEQFYLIWPLTLYIAYRFGKGRQGHWPFKITLLATFALSVYMANHAPAAAYYLLPARLFEFMLGTGVALFANQLPKLNRPLAEALAVCGLTMVIATALLITKHDHF
ncbi:MAG: acyltransferase family protein, partial [Alcanivorax nanhaiticus]